MQMAAHADSRDFALAAFRVQFEHGLALSDPRNVAAAAVDTGVEPLAAKARLRANTGRALSLGVFGVPAVVVGDQVLWGDDRLEDAAVASALKQQL